MGVLSMFKPLSEHRAVPFCNCRQRRFVVAESNANKEKQTCTCNCGESDCSRIDWTWDAAQITNHTVLFHPFYSQGTSIVQGTKPLTSQHIHYWEIKIITCMSGTDIVSTKEIYFCLQIYCKMLFPYCA